MPVAFGLGAHLGQANSPSAASPEDDSSHEHEDDSGHEHRQGVWKAIRWRLSLALPVETMSGVLLVGLEAVLLLRRLPHLRKFFHRYAALPVAALLGARIGVLLFVMIVPWLVLRSIRVYQWRHEDSVEAYSEFVRPCLRLLAWVSLAQNVVVVVECAHALWTMLGSSSPESSEWRRAVAERCVQSPSSGVWLCEGPDAWDALPIVAVAATAGLVAVLEALRMGFWKGALDKLHALDVDSPAALPKVTLRVPAKRRPLRASEEGTSCCICLSDFEAEEVITELKCGHCYHEACITTWLYQRDCCPLRCHTGSVRQRVPPAIAKGAGLEAGARARVRNTPEEPWRHGTVASTAPLLVRPAGWLYARPWEFVEAVSGEGGAPARGREHEDWFQAATSQGAVPRPHAESAAAAPARGHEHED